MKSIQILLVAFLLVASIGCKNNDKPTAIDEEGQYFGEKISDDDVIDFNQLIDKMSESEEVEAVVSGKVESVCQAKGCWMNIVSPDGNKSEEMFVKFKDYGFFMPLDISGKEVVMRGKS